MEYRLLADQHGMGEGSMATAKRAIGEYRRPRLRQLGILDGQYLINRLFRKTQQPIEDLLDNPEADIFDLMFSCAYSNGVDFWGRCLHLETDPDSVRNLITHLGWAHTTSIDVNTAEQQGELAGPVFDVPINLRHYRHGGIALTEERLYSDEPYPAGRYDNDALHTVVVSADKYTHLVDKDQVRLAVNLVDFKASRRYPINRTWIEVIAHSRN